MTIDTEPTSQTTITPETPAPPEKRDTWLDLLLYLFGGFGVFIVVSLAVGLLFQEISLWVTVAALLINVICIGGSVFVWGVFRHKLSLAEIGFWPVRWRWLWLVLAVVLAVAFIPLRGALGLAIEYLVHGNMDSLNARSNILSAGGELSWLNFIVTFVGTAVLVPIAEELYFRGLLHGWFKTRLGFWPRVLASSVLFGLAHFDSVGVMVSSFVLGVVNGVAMEKSRSLWLPIAIHMITNGLAVCLIFLALWAEQIML